MKSTYPVAVLYSLLFACSSGQSNAISASCRCVGFPLGNPQNDNSPKSR